MNAASHSFSPQAEPSADVRVMNATAMLLLVALAALVVAGGLTWLAAQPLFVFRSIRLEGDVTRNSLATIRANASPRLAGNFFNMDLQIARAAFESVPWVRHAVVRRVWPNRLVVRLEEHQPVAIWADDEGNDRLVNNFGEIFDANVGDVDDVALPEFYGDENQAREILAMYRRLGAVFMPLDLRVASVALSDRGSWTLQLDNGADVVIGRGSDEEVLARCQRFVGTVTQVAARQRRSWSHADLRHADGYALRWISASSSAATGLHAADSASNPMN